VREVDMERVGRFGVRIEKARRDGGRVLRVLVVVLWGGKKEGSTVVLSVEVVIVLT
jgi:hypothetical protein